MSYYFSNMKPKQGVFNTTYVGSTSTGTYEHYEGFFNGSEYVGSYGKNYWPLLEDRWAEDYQLAILRALTISGVSVYQMVEVFRYIYNEDGPFRGLGNDALLGKLRPDWKAFIDKIGKYSSWSHYYPCLCPAWLFPFNYTQKQYLSDLAVYWDNVPSDYGKPWDVTRIGEDSPEVARIRKVGKEARREIDVTAQHGQKHNKQGKHNHH